MAKKFRLIKSKGNLIIHLFIKITLYNFFVCFQRLCDRLPSANVTLLRHFMCVLLHITANSTQNMMSASNLAVCVGPSLLWAPLPATSTTATPSAGLNPALALSAEATASKQVPALVAVLIEKCALLFGAETVRDYYLFIMFACAF